MADPNKVRTRSITCFDYQLSDPPITCHLQLKKVLSANAEATIHVECLMNDVDVSGSMTREVFEELIQPLIDRIKITCAKVGRAETLCDYTYAWKAWA